MEKKTEEVAPADEGFQWRRQWYPVVVMRDLEAMDPRKPYSFKVTFARTWTHIHFIVGRLLAQFRKHCEFCISYPLRGWLQPNDLIPACLCPQTY